MNKKLLLIGGGGHCRAVIDSLRDDNQYADISIVDKSESIGSLVLGKRVIGNDGDLQMLYDREGYRYAFVTLGSIGDVSVRICIYRLLERLGYSIPNIIDPTAVVSANAALGNGIYIGKNAVVNAGSRIDEGAIINTSVTVEHDCSIGGFVHVSSGSVLCGNVTVGECTHIGAGSVIRQQLRIGSHTMIGMGSVVLKNIGDSVTAYGNPCREVHS